MARKVAIIITNYNMPERTDALCNHIKRNAAWPYDLIVVDNGSDLAPPSQFTTVKLERNVQTTGGWLDGLKYADTRGRYFAYWFMITSAEFMQKDTTDPLTPLAMALLDNPTAVGIHPALTPDSTTAWEHLKARGVAGLRPVWMIDNIASLYRAEWFDGIGRFDPDLIYGWGIDLETSYKARRAGYGLFVHEDVKIKKVTDIGYEMGRMKMTAKERGARAGGNMADVLGQKYGPTWSSRMREEYVTRDMV